MLTQCFFLLPLVITLMPMVLPALQSLTHNPSPAHDFHSV